MRPEAMSKHLNSCACYYSQEKCSTWNGTEVSENYMGEDGANKHNQTHVEMCNPELHEEDDG
jgi:hypothetical protein